ncbi:glycoside hydrolase domain-containing protein [Paenibacillus cineris]|uniref:glycoside hydrolase domain-containing protein n=1 Tax=Paenibacillus cineris TaxID=237530 RepID=UPI001AFF519B|nr:glycoside hydrolase domain-containing protein [Paenibacillus cineris]GIO63592.1 hypothetical protein J43TS9_51660 [Paenibacillus cineris]
MQVKAIGIDCSTRITADLAKRFKANGVAFIGRYVTPNSWKSISKAEANNIISAGLEILSVFERTADRTKGGAANGAADGKAAYSHVKSIGQPEGTAIYFAVDYDAPASQHNNIEAYLKAAAKEIPGYKIGVYGSFSVIEEMAKRKAADFYWQTLAWSRGLLSSKANVYQKQIDVPANGIGVDWNDLYSDAGLWGAPKLPVKEEIKVERDINKVSAWAADAWKEVTDNGYFDGSRPGAQITREEAGVVFNRMRKNFLLLIQGISSDVSDIEKRLVEIEKGDK